MNPGALSKKENYTQLEKQCIESRTSPPYGILKEMADYVSSGPCRCFVERKRTYPNISHQDSRLSHIENNN